jgi:aspartyl-tRNA(Asn)/glutamyl-tRNA(Gln) amidotransferase subunit A
MAIAYSMDKLGPMARTADDCALVLSVIAGHDPLDHDSISSSAMSFVYQDTEPVQNTPLRIGRLMNVYDKVDPDADKAVDEACRVFEKAGATVESCEFPDGPFEEAAELTILMEAASAFGHLIRSGKCKDLTDSVGQVNGYASEQFFGNRLSSCPARASYAATHRRCNVRPILGLDLCGSAYRGSATASERSGRSYRLQSAEKVSFG